MNLQFFSKLSDKEKKVFFIAVAFVTLALFDRLLIGPSMTKLAQLDQEIAQEKASIERDKQFLMYKDKVFADNDELEPFYSSTTQSEEQIMADYLKEVELIATKGGVDVSKILIAGQEYTDDYLKYHLTLDCSGDIDKLMEFVYTIDDADKLMRVSKFDFRPKRTDPKQAQISLMVTKILIPADHNKSAKTLVSDLKENES